LREVRAGEQIVIRDRQRPIAKIVPLTVDEDGAEDAASVADEQATNLERVGRRRETPAQSPCW
jgi:antitoxin (DNA-binding transcriptional repressor) of toxin-antitoxin stability system